MKNDNLIYAFAPGDWIAFQTFRSVGMMNEQTLVIESVGYLTTIDVGGSATKPAYITHSGKKVAESDVLEVRTK